MMMMTATINCIIIPNWKLSIRVIFFMKALWLSTLFFYFVDSTAQNPNRTEEVDPC